MPRIGFQIRPTELMIQFAAFFQMPVIPVAGMAIEYLQRSTRISSTSFMPQIQQEIVLFRRINPFTERLVSRLKLLIKGRLIVDWMAFEDFRKFLIPDRSGLSIQRVNQQSSQLYRTPAPGWSPTPSG